MRALALLLLATSAFALDVRDFGADSSGAADATAAIQRAIDALPRPLASGTAAIRLGGVVQLPAGKYRICSAGISGICVGGTVPGKLCTTAADCPGSATTATPTCSALATNGHSVILRGDGIFGTELVAMRGCNAMDGVTLADEASALENIRVVKIEQRKTGTGIGVRVRGQRVALRDVAVNGFGGTGVLVDGEFQYAKANGASLLRLIVSENGGDGIWLRSWGGPNGVGDGSQHFGASLTLQSNGGYGLRVDSSKNWLHYDANGNTKGAALVTGDLNVLSGYAEIGNQPTCLETPATADFNLLFDLSGCTARGGKWIDAGTKNHVYTNGDFVPGYGFGQ